MVPTKESDKYFLKCTKCGYVIEIRKDDTKSYRMGYEVEEEKRIVTAKATRGVRRAITPEERELLQEYYEVFLESFESEESGGESE